MTRTARWWLLLLAVLLQSCPAFASWEDQLWFRSAWPGDVAPRFGEEADCSAGDTSRLVAEAEKRIAHAQEQADGAWDFWPWSNAPEKAALCAAKSDLVSLSEGLYAGAQSQLACEAEFVTSAAGEVDAVAFCGDQNAAACTGDSEEEDESCEFCHGFWDATRTAQFLPVDATYAAGTCPIGCWRSAPGVCSPCPEVYSHCGELGGCEPRSDVQKYDAAIVYTGWAAATSEDYYVWDTDYAADSAAMAVAAGSSGARPPVNLTTPPANVTLDDLVCTCAGGFGGRRCNSKTALAGWFFVLSVIIAAPAAFQILINDPVSDQSWKYAGYGLSQIPGSIKCDSDTLSMIFQFLQLGAAAFDVSIPWTTGFVAPEILRIPAFDFKSLIPQWFEDVEAPGYAGECILLTLLVAFLVATIDLEGSMIPGTKKPFPSFKLLGEKGAAGANTLAPLIMIPAARAYGGVFVGCTYYDMKPNSFDDDPDLSCWVSALWWVYCIIAVFGLFGMLMCAKSVADADGQLQNMPSHPASVKWALLFSFVKIFVTMVHVALGRWHPRLTNAVFIAAEAYMIWYIVVRKPFCHKSITRLSIFGNIQGMVGYVSAMIAVEVDNPESASSELTFTWLSFLSMGAYLGYEGYLFNTDQSVIGKRHQAWEFASWYVVDEDSGLPPFEPKLNAQGQPVRRIVSTIEYTSTIAETTEPRLEGQELSSEEVWDILKTENVQLDSRYKSEHAAWKVAYPDGEVRDDEGSLVDSEGSLSSESEEPKLFQWTQSHIDADWAYWEPINGFNRSIYTQEYQDKFGASRKSESGGESGGGESGGGEAGSREIDNPICKLSESSDEE